MSYTGQGMIRRIFMNVIFICRECKGEMEVFKDKNKIEIVCPNCRLTKILPLEE